MSSRTCFDWPCRTTAYKSRKLVCLETDAHELGLGDALYPRDYVPMSPRHRPRAIQRRSNNRLAPVREESVHLFGESIEDNHSCVPVIHVDGHNVEVMHSGFVADSDAKIAVRGRHVRRHIDLDRERPELPKKLRYALKIHLTDETSI